MEKDNRGEREVVRRFASPETTKEEVGKWKASKGKEEGHGLQKHFKARRSTGTSSTGTLGVSNIHGKQYDVGMKAFCSGRCGFRRFVGGPEERRQLGLEH